MPVLSGWADPKLASNATRNIGTIYATILDTELPGRRRTRRKQERDRRHVRCKFETFSLLLER